MNEDPRAFPYIAPGLEKGRFALENCPNVLALATRSVRVHLNEFCTDQDIDETARAIRKVALVRGGENRIAGKARRGARRSLAPRAVKSRVRSPEVVLPVSAGHRGCPSSSTSRGRRRSRRSDPRRARLNPALEVVAVGISHRLQGTAVAVRVAKEDLLRRLLDLGHRLAIQVHVVPIPEALAGLRGAAGRRIRSSVEEAGVREEGTGGRRCS